LHIKLIKRFSAQNIIVLTISEEVPNSLDGEVKKKYLSAQTLYTVKMKKKDKIFLKKNHIIYRPVYFPVLTQWRTEFQIHHNLTLKSLKQNAHTNIVYSYTPHDLHGDV